LRNAKNVLDIGSNKALLKPFLQRETEYKQADIDLSVLKGKRAVNCDAVQLPFKDGSFDGVACCDVLEHNDKDDCQQIATEITRVTEARGTLVVTIPHELGFFPTKHHADHLHDLTPTDLEFWFTPHHWTMWHAMLWSYNENKTSFLPQWHFLHGERKP